jgi:hypothetical protein
LEVTKISIPQLPQRSRVKVLVYRSANCESVIA